MAGSAQSTALNTYMDPLQWASQGASGQVAQARRMSESLEQEGIGRRPRWSDHHFKEFSNQPQEWEEQRRLGKMLKAAQGTANRLSFDSGAHMAQSAQVLDEAARRGASTAARAARGAGASAGAALMGSRRAQEDVINRGLQQARVESLKERTARDVAAAQAQRALYANMVQQHQAQGEMDMRGWLEQERMRLARQELAQKGYLTAAEGGQRSMIAHPSIYSGFAQAQMSAESAERAQDMDAWFKGIGAATSAAGALFGGV